MFTISIRVSEHVSFPSPLTCLTGLYLPGGKCYTPQTAELSGCDFAFCALARARACAEKCDPKFRRECRMLKLENLQYCYGHSLVGELQPKYRATR
jgi:hypothetical protein